MLLDDTKLNPSKLIVGVYCLSLLPSSVPISDYFRLLDGTHRVHVSDRIILYIIERVETAGCLIWRGVSYVQRVERFVPSHRVSLILLVSKRLVCVDKPEPRGSR